MNTTKLFTAIRTLQHPLSQIQVDSVNAILASCEKHSVTDPHQISYILATAYHEARFKPISEIGKGKGYPYGGKLDIGEGPGRRKPYTTPDEIYYGRGLCMITWRSNYEAFSHLLGVDLVNNPDLALKTNYAAEIIVVGMQKGMFTGVTLSHVFNAKLCDPIDARHIVNGNNCAALIAGYYSSIYAAFSS